MTAQVPSPPDGAAFESRARSRGSAAFVAALAVITCIAIAFRFAELGAESLWFDEGWTWWLTGLAPGKILDVLRGDVMPPLYFYSLAAWRSLAGDVNEAGLRMPSAIFATLALVPFYIVVRATLRTRVATLVACLLMACSFMQVQYTREARPYALLCLMTLSALACVPTLARRRSWPALIGFALFASGGLYTHNMMVFSGVALGAAWLLWPGGRHMHDRLIDALIAGVIIAAIYLPWVPILRQQAHSITGTFWAARPGWPAARVAVGAVAGVDVYAMPSVAWDLFRKSFTAEYAGLIVAVSLLISAIAALTEPGRRRLVAAILAVTVGPLILVFCFSQVGQPIFLERVFIASSALMPILIALPLDGGHVLRRAAGAAVALVIGVMAIASAVSLFRYTQKEDWRGAHAYIAQLPPSSTRVLVFVANEGELPFDFYLRHDADKPRETGAPHGFFGPYPPRTVQQVKADSDLDDVRAELARGATEIVLFLSHDNFSDPRGLTEAFLDAHLHRVDERLLRGVRVVRYVR